MIKIIVTGANGQLGTDLCKVLHNYDVIPLTHADVEITDVGSIRSSFCTYRPDVIINTAAYVRVDDCEVNRDVAFQVNALGARNTAVVAQELGAKLVQISTDYVFGGGPDAQNTPFNEFDIAIPINTYGKSKLAGENFVRHLCNKHFIVRPSGVFGTAGSSGKGGNFIETIIKIAKERPEIRVVNDQVFSPTYTKDLAEKIGWLITTEYYGVFHITNNDLCSWFQFAQEIVRLINLDTKVIPITSEQYPQKAKRPQFSVLDNYHLKLLGDNQMRNWREALKDYLVTKKHI
jgi:dTDP-4-dehydrorhamnose reductase